MVSCTCNQGTAGKEVKMNEENEMIFKCFLRSLLRDLNDLKEAINEKELDKAETLIEQLIEDTQKSIED